MKLDTTWYHQRYQAPGDFLVKLKLCDLFETRFLAFPSLNTRCLISRYSASPYFTSSLWIPCLNADHFGGDFPVATGKAEKGVVILIRVEIEMVYTVFYYYSLINGKPLAVFFSFFFFFFAEYNLV
jgi:hypothetical protein